MKGATPRWWCTVRESAQQQDRRCWEVKHRSRQQDHRKSFSRLEIRRFFCCKRIASFLFARSRLVALPEALVLAMMATMIEWHHCVCFWEARQKRRAPTDRWSFVGNIFVHRDENVVSGRCPHCGLRRSCPDVCIPHLYLLSIRHAQSLVVVVESVSAHWGLLFKEVHRTLCVDLLLRVHQVYLDLPFFKNCISSLFPTKPSDSSVTLALLLCLCSLLRSLLQSFKLFDIAW